jgi:hypothetical protein
MEDFVQYKNAISGKYETNLSLSCKIHAKELPISTDGALFFILTLRMFAEERFLYLQLSMLHFWASDDEET